MTTIHCVRSKKPICKGRLAARIFSYWFGTSAGDIEEYCRSHNAGWVYPDERYKPCKKCLEHPTYALLSLDWKL